MGSLCSCITGNCCTNAKEVNKALFIHYQWKWGYKNAQPLGGHFHEDWKINVACRVLTRKNAPPPDGHVFQTTGIIFELIQDIIGMNPLTKFHDDHSINVASRVKNAQPFGSHVFQANVTIFELNQDIIKTNHLTKFHEDWTINVAYRMLTRQMLTADDRQNAITKAHHAQNIIVTNLLTKKNAPPLAAMFFNQPA
ncbi:hypothetical protein DPMN_047902 [Dreissena polymorpha]|uniref:Uncharacterized protein n=1 Tax=Dreissena polymorpha TaxID=45954 RepID=A0A9D4D9L7_DREPO|nr:hypothetical protein DPMN_047902 [Dreissena polymorpha]